MREGAAALLTELFPYGLGTPLPRDKDAAAAQRGSDGSGAARGAAGAGCASLGELLVEVLGEARDATAREGALAALCLQLQLPCLPRCARARAVPCLWAPVP